MKKNLLLVCLMASLGFNSINSTYAIPSLTEAPLAYALLVAGVAGLVYCSFGTSEKNIELLNEERLIKSPSGEFKEIIIQSTTTFKFGGIMGISHTISEAIIDNKKTLSEKVQRRTQLFNESNKKAVTFEEAGQALKTTEKTNNILQRAAIVAGLTGLGLLAHASLNTSGSQSWTLQ